MGSACSDVQKKEADKEIGKAADKEAEEEEDEEPEEDVEEVDEHAEERDQAEKGLNELQRGQTSVFSENIKKAKEFEVEPGKIKAAEAKLEEHKKNVRREEVSQALQKAISALDEDNYDAALVKKAVKAVADAKAEGVDVKAGEAKIKAVEARRPLEKTELQKAKKYLQQSMKDIVRACRQESGRPVSIIQVDGKKVLCTATLDSILGTLSLRNKEDSSNDLDIGIKWLQAVAPVNSAAEILKIPGYEGLSKKKGWKAKADKDFQNCCIRVDHFLEGDETDVGYAVLVENDEMTRDQLYHTMQALKCFS